MDTRKISLNSQSTRLIFPLLLVFYEIVIYLSNDMYLPALPQMMENLGMSSTEAQSTLTFWFAGAAVFPIFMGVAADKYGRRKTLLTGGFIYIIATIICAITTNLQLFLFARFLEGAIIPSMMVAGYACIHELYDEKEAIRILALMGSIVILAPAVGPLLGAAILSFTSWRGIFWFIALWSIINILLLRKWMPETHLTSKSQPARFNILIKQYARLLVNKRFMLLTCVIGFIYAGFIGWITSSPLLVIKSYSSTPIVFSVIQACIFAAYIAGNYYVKLLIDKMEVKIIIRWGLLITLGGGFLGLLVANFSATTMYPYVIAMIIYSFGAALCFAPLNRSIIETSQEPMSSRVALFTTLWTGFAALGSVIAGVVFNGVLFSIALPITIAIFISCMLMIIA
jgi:Bcr/CflA subfamily drug resistance transporter